MPDFAFVSDVLGKVQSVIPALNPDAVTRFHKQGGIEDFHSEP